jgi:Protein of unknown function (DUF1488)
MPCNARKTRGYNSRKTSPAEAAPVSVKGDRSAGADSNSNSVDFERYFFWSAHTQTVRFFARCEDRRIRCAVTRTALEDTSRALNSFSPGQLEQLFEQYRQEVERVAEQKILAGRTQPDGTVIVRSIDLNF